MTKIRLPGKQQNNHLENLKWECIDYLRLKSTPLPN